MFPLIEEDNQENLRGVLNTAIDDFVSYGHYLNEKMINRPYSALVNYSLALNLFYSSPYKTFETRFNPIGIYEDMKMTLEKITKIKGEEGAYGALLFEGFKKKYPRTV